MVSGNPEKQVFLQECGGGGGEGRHGTVSRGILLTGADTLCASAENLSQSGDHCLLLENIWDIIHVLVTGPCSSVPTQSSLTILK